MMSCRNFATLALRGLSLSLKKTQLDPKDLVNYRPISNLSILSNILEKVASSQLYSFLEKKLYLGGFPVKI